MSYTYEITTAGKTLIAKAQTGTIIDFTKVEVGKGTLAGSAAELTGLFEPVSTNVKIQQKEYIQGTGNAKITITYTNESITEGFYVKEIGLFANDPDVGEILFLYCYSSDADFLPASSSRTVEQVVNLIIAVNNAEIVTAQITPETSVIRDNFSANSILKADIDNEPEALTVGEDKIVGRKAGGEIDGLSVSEVRKLLNISDFPYRHAIQTLGNGITIDDELVPKKSNEALSEVGNGTSRSVDFGLDMVSDDNGGMVLFKNKDMVQHWSLSSSLLGEGNLFTNETSKFQNDSTVVSGYTSKGVDLGHSAYVNQNNNNFAEFGFQTTHKKVRTFENVKSVVFDFADNWGYSNQMAVRSIEFYNGDTKIELSPSDFTVYATSEDSNGYASPEFAFDTSLSKIGSGINNTSWISLQSNSTDQRLIIVFNTVKTFTRIVINNYHNSGDTYIAGVKNAKIYTSSDTITGTYGYTISNSELVFDGTIAQHSASNAEDNRGYCGVEWAYNPATGFFMILHDGDEGSADFPIQNVTGKPVLFSNTKPLDSAPNWRTYNSIGGVGKYLCINTTSGEGIALSHFKEMSETNIILGSDSAVNNAGHIHFTWGFVGEDLGYLTPGMKGVEGSVLLNKLTNGGTFNCGIDESEVQTIILKRLDAVSNWHTFDSVSGWDKNLYINDSKASLDALTFTTSFSGANLTIPSAFTGDWIVLVIGKNGLVSTQTEVKGNEVLSEVGNGTSRSIDFGLDMASGHNGGMVLSKNKNNTNSWILSNSIRGAGKDLVTNSTAAEVSEAQYVTAFNTDGVNVGNGAAVNTLNDNYAEFGFQTTHKKVREFKNVKSVIFDFADNWGYTTQGVRSIEFYSNGSVITLIKDVDYLSYSTSELSSNYNAKYVFDTNLSKIGAGSDVSWQSAGSVTTNQRMIIVFTNPVDFDKIVINNGHETGNATTIGVKNTKIHTSIDPISDTTHGAIITNSELIFDGVIAKHPASDTVDDRGYCGVEWAYNPATGFFMLLYDGDDGSTDFPINNPTGKEPIFLVNKALHAQNWPVYTKLNGTNRTVVLNHTASVATTPARYNKMNETDLILGTDNDVNAAGYPYFSFGWVGEDLGHITPGMTGIKGSVSLYGISDGGTYDCGINENDIQCIIMKGVTGSTNWYIYDSSSDFNKGLWLNSTIPEYEANNLTFNGSEITIPSGVGWAGYMILVIGKNGIMPSGKSINIKADSENPFIASIANGFGPYGPVDHPVIETANKQLNLILEEGISHLCVDDGGEYSLEKTEPDFDSSPGVMKGPEKKLKLGEVTVLSGDIVDIDLMAVGDRYESEWFPVETNTKYELENKFKDTKVDFDIWWNSTPSDENKRWVTGQFYYEGGPYSGIGAYKRVASNSLYIGTGNEQVFQSHYSGDPEASETGYYKLVVKREW
ncbi:MAG: hypothetical protein GY760_26550 [Deltaproteobacteria bacterium]|nr:hypothetical protein [Deltaproteobacteria bacterium]